VETKVRELDGKLWLALNLAARGFMVAIGAIDSRGSGIDLIRPDIYIGLNALFERRKERLYRELNKSNVKILVLDSEGGVFQSEDAYAQRLSMEILKHVDYFLAWGFTAADILQKHRPQFPLDNVAVTGNPTFDLLQKEFRRYYEKGSRHLKDKFGDYVLVNTNFTGVNHFSKEISEEISKRLCILPDSEFEAYQRRLFECFVEVIIRLSNQFPNVNIIVRPHPSENHTTYKRLLASCDNVYVEHRGAVRPWILGAIAVIHNSCTTGIESALLGKPVFAFQPVKHAKYDLFLPNLVSKSVDSADGLCKEISKLLGGAKYGGLSSAQENELQQFIYNAEDGVISANLISDVIGSLEGVGASQTAGLFGSYPRARAMRVIKAALGSKGIKLARRILGRTEAALYGRQKFPSLSEAELRARVDKLRACGVEVEDLRIERIRGLGKAFWIYKG